MERLSCTPEKNISKVCGNRGKVLYSKILLQKQNDTIVGFRRIIIAKHIKAIITCFTGTISYREGAMASPVLGRCFATIITNRKGALTVLFGGSSNVNLTVV